MDFAATQKQWNTAISLSAPSVGDVCRHLGAVPASVFDGVPDFLYLGGNLLLKAYPDFTGDMAEPALSLTMIIRHGFFKAGALVQTEAVPQFAFLRQDVPCSAQAMLDHLLEVDRPAVVSATESDRWVLHYGSALALVFQPVGQRLTTPSASELVTIEWFFSVPYKGSLPATV